MVIRTIVFLNLIALKYILIKASEQQCALEIQCKSSGSDQQQCFQKNQQQILSYQISDCECEQKDLLYNLISDGQIKDIDQKRFKCKKQNQINLQKELKKVSQNCVKNQDCYSGKCDQNKCQFQQNQNCDIESGIFCEKDLQGNDYFCENKKCKIGLKEGDKCEKNTQCGYEQFCEIFSGKCKKYGSIKNNLKTDQVGFNLQCESFFANLISSECQDIIPQTNQLNSVNTFIELKECQNDKDCQVDQEQFKCQCGLNNKKKQFCQIKENFSLQQKFKQLASEYIQNEKECSLDLKLDSRCQKTQNILQKIKSFQDTYKFLHQTYESECQMYQQFKALFPEIEVRVKQMKSQENKLSQQQEQEKKDSNDEDKLEEKKEKQSNNKVLFIVFIVIILGAVGFLYWRNRQNKNQHFEFQDKTLSPSIKVKSLTLENNNVSSKQLDNEIQFEDDNIEIHKHSDKNNIKKIDEEGNQLETSQDPYQSNDNNKSKSTNEIGSIDDSFDDSQQYSMDDDLTNSNVFNLEGENQNQPNSSRRRKGRKQSKKLLSTPKLPKSDEKRGSEDGGSGSKNKN